MAYYPKEYRRRLNIGRDGNSLIMLIAINLVVFIIFTFIKVLYYFDQNIDLYRPHVLDWFTLPANFHTLISRPWTILTHMFLHDGVWHLLGNMLWLWAFGFILQDLTGNRKLVPIFFYGALAGAVAFLLAFNFLNVLKPAAPVATALGASAGVMAVAIATTMIAPDYRIFPMLNGGIPLWVLTIVFVIIDLATIPYNNAGGHIAHIAGAAMGCAFVLLMQRGYDWSNWMNNFFDWVNNLFNPDKPKKGKGVREQLFYKSPARPFKKTPNLTQQKVDEILDKINQKGYHYLTEEEKELLKRASQEDL
jgi:membrane associated rhomboid family serine protease